MKKFLILFTVLMVSFVIPSAGQLLNPKYYFFGSNGHYRVFDTEISLTAEGDNLKLSANKFGIAYNKLNNKVAFFFALVSKDKDIIPHLSDSGKFYPSKTTVITFDDFTEVRGVKISKKKSEDNSYQYTLYIETSDSRVVNDFLNKKMTIIRIHSNIYWIVGDRYTPGLYCHLADALEKKNNFKELFNKLSGGVDIQKNIQTFKKYVSDNEREPFISGPSNATALQLVWGIYGVVNPFSTDLSKKAVLNELKKASLIYTKLRTSFYGREYYEVKGHEIICNGIRADSKNTSVQFEKGKLKCYIYGFLLPSETKLSQLMMFADDIVKELNYYVRPGAFEKFKDVGDDFIDYWYYRKSSYGTINNVKCNISVVIVKPKKNDGRKEVMLSVDIE